MKARDREVRTHEQAHKAVAGRYAGTISYDFDQGPDGRQYAVSGEVPIDASPVEGDPKATIAKMEIVIAAALAPAEPSAQDRSVAQNALATKRDAEAALRAERRAALQAERPGSLQQMLIARFEEALEARADDFASALEARRGYLGVTNGVAVRTFGEERPAGSAAAMRIGLLA